jgi:hypothetical protein
MYEGSIKDMELPLVAFFPIAVSTWEDKMQSKRSDTKAGMRNVSLSKGIGIPCPGSHHWSCVGYGGWSLFKNRINDSWELLSRKQQSQRMDQTMSTTVKLVVLRMSCWQNLTWLLLWLNWYWVLYYAWILYYCLFPDTILPFYIHDMFSTQVLRA